MAQGKKGIALKALKIIGGLFALFIVGLIVLALVLDTPRPEATPSAEAEVMAEAMLAALDADAWANTGAARWTFPSGTSHLWDRERDLARVSFGGNVVLVDLATREGVVVEGDAGDSDALVANAYAQWANDSFWLAAPYKIMDPGTARAVVVTDEGERGLLVSYSSGGVTPGDAYLWLTDGTGKPRAWRMWVSNIPVGGLEFGWGPFERTGSGALLSAEHPGLIPLTLTDIETGSTLAELVPGDDPFAPLVSRGQ